MSDPSDHISPFAGDVGAAPDGRFTDALAVVDAETDTIPLAVMAPQVRAASAVSFPLRKFRVVVPTTRFTFTPFVDVVAGPSAKH